MPKDNARKARLILTSHAGRVVTAAADLWADLKFAGEDVDELFQHLLNECGPLETTKLRLDRHFELNEPPFYFDLFGRRRKKFEAHRVPLKVADIDKWVTSGKWPIEYS